MVINLEKIFKDKNPGLFKLIPRFVLRYLKRIIHQDKLNFILKKGEGTSGIDFANIVLNEMGVNVICNGFENIPENGAVIFASNHPLAGLDAMALISFVGKKRSDMQFLVNDILTLLPNFEQIFVPVNKFGTNAKSNLIRIDKIYASQSAVMLFPAGMCSRTINGTIEDKAWQKSFAAKALKYQSPIIPVFIRGKNSAWFYNLSRFRTAIGIKANIEMFYLPDEMFKQKGKTIELIIGKPIFPNQLNTPLNPNDMAQKIRKYVYQMGLDSNISFDNFKNF